MCGLPTDLFDKSKTDWHVDLPLLKHLTETK